MEIVQAQLDKKLLQATAGRSKRSRSALVLGGLREHLQLLENLDREGYSRGPKAHEQALEAEAAWPE